MMHVLPEGPDVTPSTRIHRWFLFVELTSLTVRKHGLFCVWSVLLPASAFTEPPPTLAPPTLALLEQVEGRIGLFACVLLQPLATAVFGTTPGPRPTAKARVDDGRLPAVSPTVNVRAMAAGVGLADVPDFDGVPLLVDV